MSTHGQRKDTQSQVDEHITDANGVSAKKTLILGRAADNNFYDVLVGTDGKIQIDATLIAGDIEIGAVEIKDGTSDTRAEVAANNALSIRIKDNNGEATAEVSSPTGDNVSGSGFSALFVESFPYMFDGSAWDRVRGDSANGLLVNLGSNNDVSLNAGTNNIGDVDVASIAAGDNNIGNVDIASIAAGDNNIGNVDIASALPAGSNAIGKLAANSGVDIGDVDVTSIAAGTNTIGKVIGTDSTGVIYTGTTALTPAYAAISATTDNGNTTIVAASAGYQIRVLALMLMSDADDTDVRFESGAGGTALTGRIPLKESTGFVLPYNPAGWFQTDTGDDELLNLEITGTGNVYGMLTYVYVPD